ncbi:MAG: threonylcarbamoyl-AMP synthase [Nitrospirae bacterium]|nr:threonylcarbamoyl-AMP synthase [Nitrospirota bacterium]MBF0590515.1 threonylcarbamoyl-AMP synthase [Nitrospirota bacterium]
MLHLRLSNVPTTKELPRELRVAIEALNEGKVIAYPTETFYALGVRYDNNDALKRLSDLKGRPGHKPFPLIIGDQRQLDTLAINVIALQRQLMLNHWPGPLTILFEAAGGLSPYIVGTNNKVAIRLPAESFALTLARAATFAITATSANPSSMPPSSRASEVLSYFGSEIDVLIDGGNTSGGLPSTLVDVTGGVISVLRQGRVYLA